MPRTRHTVSGVIDENTPEHIVTHPVLGQYLEVVDEDAKPFLPEMHKPTKVEREVVDEHEAPAIVLGMDGEVPTHEKNGKAR